MAWWLAMVLIPLLSSSGDGPNADSHTKTTDVSSLIKSDLDKPTVSRQNIAELVHCCTPTETLVDVIKDIGCVRFTNAREVGGDFSAQS
jgi:hypothetical protein